MRTLRYVLCDVFTDRPLTGNPLAVFTDSRGLDTETMQAIAREMNLSECSFVFSPEKGGHAKIRIFTPTHEMRFAGHPTLGSAFVLGGPLQADRVDIETGAGTIAVRLEREAARISFGWMQQNVPTAEPYARDAELLAALRVERSLAPVMQYDNGARHVFVVLESKAAVAALAPDLSALAEHSPGINVCAGEGTSWKTRMFAHMNGIREDPATGSAAGPLAVHLALHGKAAFNDTLCIDQGEEIQRPSKLFAVARGSAESIEAVEVGGSAVILGRGEIRI